MPSSVERKSEINRNWYARKKRGEGRWARKYDNCQKCGGADRPHFGRGLCSKCYNNQKRYGGECPACGREFESTSPVQMYCSRKCAPKKQPKFKTAAEVWEVCSKAIQEEGKYTSRTRLFELTNVRDRDFTKFGISPVDINVELGYGGGPSRTRPSHEYAYAVMRKRYPDLEAEKRVRGVQGPTGRYWPFDFYIPSLNLLIELDGASHHGARIQVDEWKALRACAGGYRLVRILTPQWGTPDDAILERLDKAIADLEAREAGEQPSSETEKHQCQICKKSFWTTRAKGPKSKFCTRECFKAEKRRKAVT